MTRPVAQRVEWVDSTFTEEGWKDIDEVMERCKDSIVSCGFVAGEDNDVLVLALSWNPTEHSKDWGSVFVIPKRAIVSRRTLRLNGK